MEVGRNMRHMLVAVASKHGLDMAGKCDVLGRCRDHGWYPLW